MSDLSPTPLSTWVTISRGQFGGVEVHQGSGHRSVPPSNPMDVENRGSDKLDGEGGVGQKFVLMNLCLQVRSSLKKEIAT